MNCLSCSRLSFSLRLSFLVRRLRAIFLIESNESRSECSRLFQSLTKTPDDDDDDDERTREGRELHALHQRRSRINNKTSRKRLRVAHSTPESADSVARDQHRRRLMHDSHMTLAVHDVNNESLALLLLLSRRVWLPLSLRRRGRATQKQRW